MKIGIGIFILLELSFGVGFTENKGQKEIVNPLCKIQSCKFEMRDVNNGFQEEIYHGFYYSKMEGVFDWLLIASSGNDDYNQLAYALNDSIYFFRRFDGEWFRSYQTRTEWISYNMVFDPVKVAELFIKTGDCMLPLNYKEITYSNEEQKWARKGKRSDRYLYDTLQVKSGVVKRSLIQLSHANEVLSEEWSFHIDKTAAGETHYLVEKIMNNEADTSFSKHISQRNQVTKKILGVDSDFSNLMLYPMDSEVNGDSLYRFHDSTKWTIVDFWYIGCKPCYELQGTLVRFLEDNSLCDSVKLLRVNVYDQNRERIEAHLEKYSSTCVGESDFVNGIHSIKEYQPVGFPILLVFNKQGELKLFHIGYTNDLIPTIQNLIAP